MYIPIVMILTSFFVGFYVGKTKEKKLRKTIETMKTNFEQFEHEVSSAIRDRRITESEYVAIRAKIIDAQMLFDNK